MKVLVVINSLTSGGAERVVSNLTREWASTHEVLIALFDTGRQAYDHGAKIEDLGTPPLRNPVKKLYNLLLRSIRLVRVLRRECPDRILSFMESANFPTIMAASVVGLLDRLCISVRCNSREDYGAEAPSNTDSLSTPRTDRSSVRWSKASVAEYGPATS